MATLKNRLALIEAKLMPKEAPGLNLGRTAGTLERLREIVADCHEHNKPGGGGIHYYANYTGAPCDESAALLASCRPQEDRKTISVTTVKPDGNGGVMSCDC